MWRSQEVKSENIVKGYQYEKGKYIILTEEDFDKIKTKKDRNITIDKFVNIEEVDPIYLPEVILCKSYWRGEAISSYY